MMPMRRPGAWRMKHQTHGRAFECLSDLFRACMLSSGTDWMAELTQFSGLLREKERSSDGKLSTSHPMLEAFLADTFSAKTAGVLLGMRGDDSVQILSCLEGIIELGE